MSITINIGNIIPAAIIGLMDMDIKGTASIAIGPANPPFEIPNNITAGIAVT